MPLLSEKKVSSLFIAISVYSVCSVGSSIKLVVEQLDFRVTRCGSGGTVAGRIDASHTGHARAVSVEHEVPALPRRATKKKYFQLSQRKSGHNFIETDRDN